MTQERYQASKEHIERLTAAEDARSKVRRQLTRACGQARSHGALGRAWRDCARPRRRTHGFTSD